MIHFATYPKNIPTKSLLNIQPYPIHIMNPKDASPCKYYLLPLNVPDTISGHGVDVANIDSHGDLVILMEYPASPPEERSPSTAEMISELLSSVLLSCCVFITLCVFSINGGHFWIANVVTKGANAIEGLINPLGMLRDR